MRARHSLGWFLSIAALTTAQAPRRPDPDGHRRNYLTSSTDITGAIRLARAALPRLAAVR